VAAFIVIRIHVNLLDWYDLSAVRSAHEATGVRPPIGDLIQGDSTDRDLLSTEGFVEMARGVVRQDPAEHGVQAGAGEPLDHPLDQQSSHALTMVRVGDIDGVELALVAGVAGALGPPEAKPTICPDSSTAT
jgi:hypothetical protein